MVCVAFYLTGALKISLEFIKINHNDSSSSLQFIIMMMMILLIITDTNASLE